MRRLLLPALGFALAAEPATAQPPLFNLVCSGTVTMNYFTGSSTRPYSIVRRLDLERGKWCEDGCGTLHDFVSVSATLLTLEDRRADPPRQGEALRHTINRQTGEERIDSLRQLGDERMIRTWRGTCVHAPFTGLPR
jgi:hypothetical protein